MDTDGLDHRFGHPVMVGNAHPITYQYQNQEISEASVCPNRIDSGTRIKAIISMMYETAYAEKYPIRP